jgi:hypothetical protein
MICYQLRKQCILMVRIVALYARIQEQLDTLGVSLLHCHKEPERSGPMLLLGFAPAAKSVFISWPSPFNTAINSGKDQLC